MSVPRYCSEVEPENMPDMVAVVRCKDCEYGEDWGALIACGKARGFGLTHDKDWFCADGERKNGDGDV